MESGIMGKNIDSLGLKTRARLCLKNDGIEEVGQLVNYSVEDILRIPNAGKVTVSEIQSVLHRHGLRLSDRPLRKSKEETESILRLELLKRLDERETELREKLRTAYIYLAATHAEMSDLYAAKSSEYTRVED